MRICGLNRTMHNYHHQEAIGHAESRARACRVEAEERERQTVADRWYREDELRGVTRELERAHSRTVMTTALTGH